MTILEELIARRQARTVTWFVPVATPNPLNGSHGHWRVKHARAAEHHEETVTLAPKGVLFKAPVLVVLRRYYCGAPHQLDPRDNLPASLKWVADGVAEVVGIDDGDESNFFVEYEQERVRKRSEVGVRVTVISGARVVKHIEFVEDGPCHAG